MNLKNGTRKSECQVKRVSVWPTACLEWQVNSLFAAILSVFALALSMGCRSASAQRLFFGAVGGSSVTGDFQTLRYKFPLQGSSYTEISETGPRSLIIGPMAELAIRGNWSVEVNALHRSLKYRIRTDSLTTVCAGFCSGGVSTWQFPLLVKYRIPVSPLKPFLTAGPTFRTHSSPIGSRPSSYGATAGAGIELSAGWFYLAPTIRYTRWGDDGLPFRPTIRNQVEVLGGIGYRTTDQTRRPLGRKVWLGILAGVPLTNDFPPISPDSPVYTGEAGRFADVRSAAGLMAEVEVARNVSVEVNGLYRRLHFNNAPEVVVTWQIPV